MSVSHPLSQCLQKTNFIFECGSLLLGLTLLDFVAVNGYHTSNHKGDRSDLDVSS